MQDRLTLDGLLFHTNRLQEIADKNNGTREFGYAGHQATIDYIVNFVQQLGDAYDVHTEPMDLEVAEYVDQQLVVAATNESITILVMTNSLNTPDSGLSADLVHVLGGGCLASDYANGSVVNKMVLLQRGVCTFNQMSHAAHEAGAAAMIVYNNEDKVFRGGLDRNSTNSVPSGCISQSAGERLISLLGEGPVRLNLTLVQVSTTRHTYNVIAETRAGDKSNVVVVGAHTDSVKAGPGINDNGSGTAALLEVARALQPVQQLQNAVRFCWWSAEEAGMLGSGYHVKQLSPDELRRIALYLNFDMLASPNYITGIHDVAQIKGNATAPAGSEAITTMFKQYFDNRHVPHDPADIDKRSDYSPFAEAGIPFGGVLAGAEKNKTEEQAARYGGEAGKPYDACYHAACDTTQNLNHPAFLLHSQAAAHAVATYATSTATVRQHR